MIAKLFYVITSMFSPILYVEPKNNSYRIIDPSKTARRRRPWRPADHFAHRSRPSGRARHWRRARRIRQWTQSRLAYTAAEVAARGGQRRAASAANFALPITAAIEDEVVAANIAAAAPAAKVSNVKAAAATLTCCGPENATAGAPT